MCIRDSYAMFDYNNSTMGQRLPFNTFGIDASGNTILSKEKADFMKRWKELNDAFENQTIITGKVVRRIKGGLIVDLGVVQAFLPGSQVDVRPIQDFDIYLDREIEIRIVKFNESRKNIVV